MTATTCLVGVDLGGTSIRAAVALGGGAHAPAVRRPTPAHAGAGAVLDAVAAAARDAAAGAPLAGVAVGVPGPLDPGSGHVFDAPHLVGWHGLDAGPQLAERLGCPVLLQNDARVATYAEWQHGAGRGATDMVFLTVSTGIGGGIVCGGRLVTGATGTAGELGHVPVSSDGRPCSQGHAGCLEGTASGTAIAERAAEAIAAGTATALEAVPAADLDGRAVLAAALAGDALAVRLIGESGRALGRAIGGYLNVLAPAVVVIGGGLINFGDLLLGPLHAAVAEIGFEVARERCRIVTAALGTDAGLVGATAWAWDQLGGA